MAVTEFNDTAHFGIFTTGPALNSSTGKYARMSEIVLSALRAQGALDNLVDSTTAPATDKLWLDKNTDPAVLKEWDSIGSNWAVMTFDRLFGRAVVTPLTVKGGTANAITVSAPTNFIDNRLYSITPTANNTGAAMITVSGVGTFDVQYPGGTALSADELVDGESTILLFVSGNFEVVVSKAAAYAAITQAEAAAGRAEDARDAAEAAAGGLTYANDAEADDPDEDNRIVSPEQYHRLERIHRDYRDFVRDFDGATGATSGDQRAVLANAFGTIAIQGTKRTLQLPKGDIHVNFSELVSLTPPEGLVLRGEGPDKTKLILSCGTAATRTVFNHVNSWITYEGLSLDVSLADTALGAIYLMMSLNNAKGLYARHFNINGRVEYKHLEAPTDPEDPNYPERNTLRHNVMVMQRANSPFEDIDVDYCDWSWFNRAWLNDHNNELAVTKGVRFGPGFYFHDFFREGFAINAPKSLSEDWEFDRSKSRNCWDRAGITHHYGLGNSKKVRILGVHASGWGSFAHIEEACDDLIMAHCIADLREGNGGRYLLITDNNVGTGQPVLPQRIHVHDGIGLGTRVTGSRGILLANDASAGNPGSVIDIHDMTMNGFERGYDIADDVEGLRLHDNATERCIVGFRAGPHVHRRSIDPAHHNVAYDCETSYLIDTDVTRWGSAYKGNANRYRDAFPASASPVLGGYWTAGIGSDGAANVAMLTGGGLRLVSGSSGTPSFAANGCRITGKNEYLPAKGTCVVSWTARLMNDLAAHRMFIGFTDAMTFEMPIEMGAGGAITSNASSAVGFGYSSATDDPDRFTALGVAGDVDATAQVLSGVVPALDTDYLFEVHAHPDGSAEFFIDGAKVGTTMSGAVNPASALRPVAVVSSGAAASRRLEIKLMQADALPA